VLHRPVEPAIVNRPEGRCYVETFAALMKRDGMDTDDNSTKTAMTAVLWLHDDPERITALRELRDAMKPGERARLNSPISARQRVEKILKARAKGSDAEAKDKASPVARLKAQIAEKDREIAKLTARSDGSLFDLRADDVKSIAEAIAANISENKASALASAITLAVKKRKRKRQSPAG
jgi:hypothetical protein